MSEIKSRRFLTGSTTEREEAGPGVTRRIMGYDEKIMMVEVSFEKGGIGTLHHHTNSQVTYVVSGKFEVSVEGETKLLGPGDGFYTVPDETHGVVCIEEGTLVDVFSPYREDFL